MEESLDEEQENLNSTLEKLSQAEKDADEARRSKKVVEARASKDEGRLKEMEEQLQEAKGKT